MSLIFFFLLKTISDDQFSQDNTISIFYRVVPTKQETTPYLIPGKKLEVIHEISPEVVSEPSREQKASLNDDAAAASRSSSRGRQHVTVAAQPNLHSTHVPRSCTKKLK